MHVCVLHIISVSVTFSLGLNSALTIYTLFFHSIPTYEANLNNFDLIVDVFCAPRVQTIRCYYAFFSSPYNNNNKNGEFSAAIR